MSLNQQKPTIYNSNNYSTNSGALTLAQANNLFYSKSSPNLVVSGTVTATNETVFGSISASTLSTTGAVNFGANNTTHTINGTIASKGALNVNDTSGNAIISASSSGLSLGKLPRMATTITPTNANDLVTKGYSDGNMLDIRPMNNTFTGTNTFNICPQTSATAINNNDIPKFSYILLIKLAYVVRCVSEKVLPNLRKWINAELELLKMNDYTCFKLTLPEKI
jgi:hypothetical protein